MKETFSTIKYIYSWSASLAESVRPCPSVCPSRWTLISRKLQELDSRRGLVCRFLSLLRSASLFRNAHKPHKTVLEYKFYLKCIGLINTYRLTQKKFATPTLTPIALKSVYRPSNHILRSRVGGAFQSRFAACISPLPFAPFSWVTGIW